MKPGVIVFAERQDGSLTCDCDRLDCGSEGPGLADQGAGHGALEAGATTGIIDRKGTPADGEVEIVGCPVIGGHGQVPCQVGSHPEAAKISLTQERPAV